MGVARRASESQKEGARAKEAEAQAGQELSLNRKRAAENRRNRPLAAAARNRDSTHNRGLGRGGERSDEGERARKGQ